MKTKHQHIVPRKESWAVKPAGGERASKRFKTRGEAIEYAKNLAKKHNVCMVVHDDESKFEEFDCKPEIRNQHVVSKEGGWAVISAGGKEVSGMFPNKGTAMAHAYDIATKSNVCMLVHDKKTGRFRSVSCPPEGHPGILEVFRMKMKI